MVRPWQDSVIVLHWCLKRWSCSDGAVLLMHAAFQGFWPTWCAAQWQAGAGLISRHYNAGWRRFQSGRGA